MCFAADRPIEGGKLTDILVSVTYRIKTMVLDPISTESRSYCTYVIGVWRLLRNPYNAAYNYIGEKFRNVKISIKLMLCSLSFM
jgi:hypothetical protein